MPVVAPEDRITQSESELSMDFSRAWKGDEASYSAIHKWMRLHYPKIGRCEWCGRTDCPTEHARARSDRMTRNWADWLELCIACHRIFDGNAFTGRTHTMESRRRMSETRKCLVGTHCKHGHAFSPDNTYITTKGHRVCRICVRENKKRWRQRQSQ